jgi:predicted metal-dependent hydrolase
MSQKQAKQIEEITVGDTTIAIIRSAQRRRTVTLERLENRYVLRAPVSLVGDELHALAGRLLQRYSNRQRRRALNDDGALRRRADELNWQLFGGTLKLASIRYVTNQRRRYGSCTPSRGTIRISDSLVAVPDWVRDYVIVHELAHLAEANHGPKFWELVNRYPLTERARGYLMALGLEEGAGDLSTDDADSVDGSGVV